MKTQFSYDNGSHEITFWKKAMENRLSHRMALEFLVLSALWGASFLFTRTASLSFGPWATAGLRVGVAAAILAPLLYKQEVRQSFLEKWRMILWVGILNSGLPFALYAWSVLHIPTGMAGVLNATVPLTGALVAWLWLGDKPSRQGGWGLLLGFVGVLLLMMLRSGKTSTQGFEWDVHAIIGMCAALGATLCYGIAASFTKKYLTGTHPLATATGSQIGASLALLPLTWFFWPSTSPTWAAWGAVGVLGLFCTAIAYIMFFRIIATTGPAKALTVTFIVPVFAMLYGVILLDEALSGAMLLCAMIILLGTALSTGFLKMKSKK